MWHKRIWVIKSRHIKVGLLVCTSGVSAACQLCGEPGAAYSFFDLSWHPSSSLSSQSQQQWLQHKSWPSWSFWDSCLQNDQDLCRTCRGCCPAAICTHLQLASHPYQACWSSPVCWNWMRTGCWSSWTSQRSWQSWGSFWLWISFDWSWTSCLQSWRAWLGTRWVDSLSCERSRLCAPNSAHHVQAKTCWKRTKCC